MKKLQKLIEYGKNYTEYKPIHDELKKLQNGWTNKRDKYEEAHRAELTLWNAASRYLHANLPKGTKTLPSMVIALLGVAVLLTYSLQNGLILLVMAFLISPMGLPLAAIWLLGKVQSLKFAIQDWVYS